MLTIKDVCELSGIEAQTLRNWIATGLIKPAKVGGVGRSNGHGFSLMQAVGLIVAEDISRSDRGCVQAFEIATVKAFGNMSEEWLLDKLAHTGHFYVMPHYEKPVLQADDCHGCFPDVGDAYKRVTAYAAKTKCVEV